MTTVRELVTWISSMRRSEQRRKCSRRDCPEQRPAWLTRRHSGILAQGAWCCGPECLERSLHEGFQKVLAGSAPNSPVSYRVPLGLLMLSRGAVDRESLQSALDAQRKAGQGKIGAWLRKLARLSEQDVIRALGAQWACPVLIGDQRIEAPPDLLPQRLMEAHHMLPVRWTESPRLQQAQQRRLPGVRGTLFLGFADHINHRVLYAIEQILDCETKPCVIAESSLWRHLERMRKEREKTGGELVFENAGSAAEMARITRNYAAQLGTDEARYALCCRHLWVRLRNHQTTDLLFALPAGEATALEADVYADDLAGEKPREVP
jgi:hypothetical protein